ncbi:MAG: hypothetical protein ABUS57_02380 [Pseudomonadota bacterium]
MRLIALAFASAALFAAAAFADTAPTAQPKMPDCSASEFRAFDFWIGEWDVYRTGTTTPLAGRSTIASEDGGCVISEHWRSQRVAYTGHSLNLYDRDTRHWQQFWVDSTGDVTHFIGGPTADGGMQLTAEGDTDTDDETPHYTRMTFTHNADGSVRQYGDSSPDGVHWTERYDFTYRRHVG